MGFATFWHVHLPFCTVVATFWHVHDPFCSGFCCLMVLQTFMLLAISWYFTLPFGMLLLQHCCHGSDCCDCGCCGVGGVRVYRINLFVGSWTYFCSMLALVFFILLIGLPKTCKTEMNANGIRHASEACRRCERNRCKETNKWITMCTHVYREKDIYAYVCVCIDMYVDVCVYMCMLVCTDARMNVLYCIVL